MSSLFYECIFCGLLPLSDFVTLTAALRDSLKIIIVLPAVRNMRLPRAFCNNAYPEAPEEPALHPD